MKRFDPNAYGNPMAKARPKNPPPSTVACQTQLSANDQRVTNYDSSSTKPPLNYKGKEDTSVSNRSAKESAVNTQPDGRFSKGRSFSKDTPTATNVGQKDVGSTTRPASMTSESEPIPTGADQGCTSKPSDMAGSTKTSSLSEFNLVTATPCPATADAASSQSPDKPTGYLHEDIKNTMQAKTDSEVDPIPKAILQKSKHLTIMVPMNDSVLSAHRHTEALGHASEDQAPISDLLSIAQNEQLRSIQLRLRAKEKKDATTSLRDLDIARTPISTPFSLAQATAPASTPGAQSVQRTMQTSATIPTTRTHRPKASPASDHNRQNETQDKESQGLSRPKSRAGNTKTKEHNLRQAPPPNRMGQSLWASRNDLKPVEMDIQSNVWGSSVPSNASQASNDSVRPLHAGKVLQVKSSERLHPLQGWDGAMQPPPTDWNERPRFDNNAPEFRDDLAKWNQKVYQMTIDVGEHEFKAVSRPELVDTNMNPDGIGLVSRDTTINKMNAARYGYCGVDAEEAIKYAQPIKKDDFKDWGKLDMSRPENNTIRTETTDELVTNWVKHTEERRRLTNAQIEAQEQSAQAIPHVQPAPNPNKPILNIYLRPACGIDLSQMTDIYNWYIENSPRTAETMPIVEEDMQQRFADVRHGKLPFLVAIERNLTSAISYDLEAEADAYRRDPHPIKNIDPTQRSIIAQERVVGWACAQDFTAADFVERISVELEIYVDPAYRQLGVGKCLMDKLMESCDRGFMRRGGYQFYCPQEHKHLYTAGGGRDLHKVIFIVRKWKYPKNTAPPNVDQKYGKANPKRQADDCEDDYEMWLKKWLESWSFEVEGVLKGAGAKNGRFIDLVHLGRETRWQPTEGRIPDPLPSF